MNIQTSHLSHSNGIHALQSFHFIPYPKYISFTVCFILRLISCAVVIYFSLLPTKRMTSVFECEDLLFTLLEFLGHDHYNLLQCVSKDFLRTSRGHFSHTTSQLKYYCSSVNLLSWAVEEGGCPQDLWRSKGMLYGAELGSLEVLQWLRAQRPPCPWSYTTCFQAAYGGHLTVLQWLRAQDPPCPWSEGTCRAAAARGHLTVLQWLRAQDPPCP